MAKAINRKPGTRKRPQTSAKAALTRRLSAAGLKAAARRKRQASTRNAPAARSSYLSAAWPPFSQKLAAVLEKLEEDQFLILSVKRTNRFVQFAAQGAHGMRMETTSNNYLAQPDRLNKRQIATLVDAGWHDPTGTSTDSTPERDPDGSPNFFVDFPGASVSFEAVAKLAVSTLAEILRVPYPGFLQYTAFGENMRAVVLPELGLKLAKPVALADNQQAGDWADTFVDLKQSTARDQELAYSRDVTQWQEVAVPRESDYHAWIAWLSATADCRLKWQVFTENGKPYSVVLKDDGPYLPEDDIFSGASSRAAVKNGWLVSHNRGEFGGAIYWFSRDGKRRYQISEHQVIDFLSLPSGVHAIEGLNHMASDRGSVIRIERPKPGARWKATTIALLPSEPSAASVLRNGTILIVLSSAVVSVGTDGGMYTLLVDAPWRGLSLNSSTLSQDERLLYIGMQQFVGEFDLITKKVRFLIPSKKFLNKPPKVKKTRGPQL